MTQAHALMVQGTTSDAGKSTLVAGLARALVRRGLRVAPFKPQNMALNSAVTTDGGEIGRAQALQAVAARVAPVTDFNPVLLKPSSDIGAQVIIHGRAVANLSARDYHQYKPTAMAAVMASWGRLTQAYDWVLVEGAGSPAEINLRDRDIANMGFAEAADVPVILVADIDRGGVFAHLVGTLELLSPSEQARVKGFVINRFRGDISLLQSGLDWLEARTGRPVFGVLPYLKGMFLDAEDALADGAADVTADAPVLRVVAPVYPRVSNHTDLDALRLHPQVDFRWVGPGEVPPPADLIVLPGSKSVQADLVWLREQGWEAAILRHLRYGGKVIGICGGFQMLGQRWETRMGSRAGRRRWRVWVSSTWTRCSSARSSWSMFAAICAWRGRPRFAVTRSIWGCPPARRWQPRPPGLKADVVTVPGRPMVRCWAPISTDCSTTRPRWRRCCAGRAQPANCSM